MIDKVEPISFYNNGKFLILFQNNSELRSSGGFIGSFAVLQMENFEVKDLTFNTNIYKLDNSFTKTNYVEAPGPLKDYLKGHSWSLRDSNYDLSFPEAAADISHFYQAETGDKIDGIVAINASLMVDLLKLTGPIRLDKYNLTVNADNFFTETQFQIEKAYFSDPQNLVQNEPKEIIKDLYPQIISRALAQNKMKLIALLKGSLANKNIQLYFNDPSKENVVLAKNWAGQISQENDLNYLYIATNNYGGNKSSLSIHQNTEYEIVGRLVYLTISRIHQGTNNWPDGINQSYLRILVPNGSVLNAATQNGQDIKTSIDQNVEAGKTSFGISESIAPGQAMILKFEYELPKEIDNKNLLVQKQPGMIGDELRMIRSGRIVYDGLLKTDLTLE